MMNVKMMTDEELREAKINIEAELTERETKKKRDLLYKFTSLWSELEDAGVCIKVVDPDGIRFDLPDELKIIDAF